MSFVAKALVSISRLGGRTGLVLKAKSPEILLGVGVVGVVGTVVMACSATLRMDEILDEAQEKEEKAAQLKDEQSEEVYTDKEYKQDLLVIKVQTAMKIARLYAPAALVGGASLTCIIAGHNILRARNIAVMAAYKVLDEGFKAYRARVVGELGEEADYRFRHGLRKSEVYTLREGEVDADGNPVYDKEEQLVPVGGPKGASIYAKWYIPYDPNDKSGSKNHNESAEYNITSLQWQEKYFTDLLYTRGHVTLSEVYNALGFEHTNESMVVGWLKDKGDNVVDFGLNNSYNSRFMSGQTPDALLDFNVDGVIYGLL